LADRVRVYLLAQIVEGLDDHDVRGHVGQRPGPRMSRALPVIEVHIREDTVLKAVCEMSPDANVEKLVSDDMRVGLAHVLFLLVLVEDRHAIRRQGEGLSPDGHYASGVSHREYLLKSLGAAAAPSIRRPRAGPASALLLLPRPGPAALAAL